jgi:hypothetical protein
MNAELGRTDGSPELARQQKRRRLMVLSETVWEIEDMLAQAKKARTELMSSLQSDIRTEST